MLDRVHPHLPLFVFLARTTPGYFIVLLCLLAGISGLLLFTDLFNIFVFLEIMGICTSILALQGQKPRSLMASLRYLMTSSLAAGLFLIGVCVIYTRTGSLGLEDFTEFFVDPTIPVELKALSMSAAVSKVYFLLMWRMMSIFDLQGRRDFAQVSGVLIAFPCTLPSSEAEWSGIGESQNALDSPGRCWSSRDENDRFLETPQIRPFGIVGFARECSGFSNRVLLRCFNSLSDFGEVTYNVNSHKGI